MSLSRIDLCVSTPSLLPCITGTKYTQWGISDHSPLVFHLEVRPTTALAHAPWKLNAFWLNLFPSHASVNHFIADFLAAHENHEDILQSLKLSYVVYL